MVRPTLGCTLAPICLVLVGAFIIQSFIFPLFTSLLTLLPHPLTQTPPPQLIGISKKDEEPEGNTLTEYPSLYFGSPCPAQAWASPLSRGSLSHPLGAPASRLASPAFIPPGLAFKVLVRAPLSLHLQLPISPSNHMKPGMYPRRVLFSLRAPP